MLLRSLQHHINSVDRNLRARSLWLIVCLYFSGFDTRFTTLLEHVFGYFYTELFLLTTSYLGRTATVYVTLPSVFLTMLNLSSRIDNQVFYRG
jgi:hypothetical protein